MTLPEATRDDVEDGVTLSIAGLVKRINSFDDGNVLVRFVDLDGNELDFKIWSGDTDHDMLETGEWFLFHAAKGDVFDDEVQIESNFGNAEIEPIDGPSTDPEQSTSDGTAESVQDGVLAFDIETVSTVPEATFNFRNSDHLELLSIGVGFAPNGDDPVETDVLVRSGTAPADEVTLLERFCDYVERQTPEELLFYKGLDFDKRHVLGRAERLDDSDGLHGRVQAIFDSHDLVNLDPPGSLEDNTDVTPTYWDVYTHSLDPVAWRESHPNWDDDTRMDVPHVENTDIPYFGERYLALADDVDESDNGGVEYRSLRELIVHYTRADIEPLFEL